MQNLVNALDFHPVTVQYDQITIYLVSQHAHRHHKGHVCSRADRLQLVRVVLVRVHFLYQPNFNLRCVCVHGRDHLRKLEVFEGAAHCLGDVVELAELQLVEHEDVHVEVPHELATEDGQLAPIDDVSVEGGDDLCEAGAGQVCHIFSREERGSCLGTLQMIGNLALLRLAGQRLLHLSLDHAQNLRVLLAESDLARAEALLDSALEDAVAPVVQVGATVCTHVALKAIHDKLGLTQADLLLHFGSSLPPLLSFF